jgi:hypothetical protein
VTARKDTSDDIDAALASMSADDLRAMIVDILAMLDERTHARALTTIVSTAARGASGWVPAAVDADAVAEADAFAKAAKRNACAEPADVDEHLHRASTTFLRQDYAIALYIFDALLPPIAEAEIDLGQHELIDEVLGVDPDACAAQYAVSAYMTADPSQRAEAVLAAIDAVRGAGCFLEPIRAMERAAVEPLPEFDAFLSRWRALLAARASDERSRRWDTSVDRWLRDAVHRIDGLDGLAELARSTKRAGDLRAWCDAVVATGDWQAALSAFEEAATLARQEAYVQGEFLDGAALAAQELETKDLSQWLERAWRAAPSMLRLRRWLGAARSKQAIRTRAAAALDSCPVSAHRQCAFLHVMLAEFEAAATLLAAAPGLGWSSNEHPGHLLIPTFEFLLREGHAPQRIELLDDGMALDDYVPLASEHHQPRIAAPEIHDLLRIAGVERIPDATSRSVVLAAMREAADKRLAGVTQEKRRRHYGHAASLVAACMACDPSPDAVAWAKGIRERYRRYSALRAELNRRGVLS